MNQTEAKAIALAAVFRMREARTFHTPETPHLRVLVPLYMPESLRLTFVSRPVVQTGREQLRVQFIDEQYHGLFLDD